MNKRYIAIFTIFKDGKVLIEKRPPGSILENHITYLAGEIEDSEMANFDIAFKREVLEELGITPTKWKLLSDKPVPGVKNTILIPYLIEDWEGKIPNKVLDAGNPIFWVDIDIMANSPIKPLRVFTEILEDYLKRTGTKSVK